MYQFSVVQSWSWRNFLTGHGYGYDKKTHQRALLFLSSCLKIFVSAIVFPTDSLSEQTGYSETALVSLTFKWGIMDLDNMMSLNIFININIFKFLLRHETLTLNSLCIYVHTHVPTHMYKCIYKNLWDNKSQVKCLTSLWWDTSLDFLLHRSLSLWSSTCCLYNQ